MNEQENKVMDNTQDNPKENYSFKDKMLLIISVVIGFLFCELIVFEGFGLSVPVFLAAFYAGAIYYLKSRDCKFTKTGLLLFIPVVLLSFCFVIFSNMVLLVLNVMFLFLYIFIHLIYLTDNQIFERFSPGMIIDLLHGIFILPLANIGKVFGAIEAAGKNSKSKRVLLQVLIGIVIAIPVLIVVLLLLMSSDYIFDKLFRDVFESVIENIGEYIAKIILAVIFAFPLFSLFFSLKHRLKYVGSPQIRKNTEFISNATTVTFLGLINSVYLLYIIVQFGYLFNAFNSILPEGFNNSQYARRGFFELCVLTFINLTLFLLCYLLSKKENGKLPFIQKIMFTILTVATFIMIISAFSKMAFYIIEYGLTPLRVYTSWFMLMIAVIFIGVLIKIYSEKFKLFRMSLITATVMFIILNIANTDMIIAGVNYTRYKNNIDDTLDFSIYKKLSYDVVPYEIKLLDDEDPEVVVQAFILLEDNRVRLSKDSKRVHGRVDAYVKPYYSWKLWNYSKYRARKLIEENSEKMEAKKVWLSERGIDDHRYNEIRSRLAGYGHTNDSSYSNSESYYSSQNDMNSSLNYPDYDNLTLQNKTDGDKVIAYIDGEEIYQRELNYKRFISKNVLASSGEQIDDYGMIKQIARDRFALKMAKKDGLGYSDEALKKVKNEFRYSLRKSEQRLFQSLCISEEEYVNWFTRLKETQEVRYKHMHLIADKLSKSVDTINDINLLDRVNQYIAMKNDGEPVEELLDSIYNIYLDNLMYNVDFKVYECTSTDQYFAMFNGMSSMISGEINS